MSATTRFMGSGVACPGMGGAALRRPALPVPRREAARQHAEAEAEAEAEAA